MRKQVFPYFVCLGKFKLMNTRIYPTEKDHIPKTFY